MVIPVSSIFLAIESLGDPLCTLDADTGLMAGNSVVIQGNSHGDDMPMTNKLHGAGENNVYTDGLCYPTSGPCEAQYRWAGGESPEVRALIADGEVIPGDISGPCALHQVACSSSLVAAAVPMPNTAT